MGGRGGFILAAATLVAAGLACGITAVGQRIDGDANAEGGASSSSGAGSSGASSSSGAASSSGGSSGASGDASLDGGIDAPVDAPIDTGPVCPSACNGGCDGGCIINGGATPTCPPGVTRCEITCAAAGDCTTVTCGDAGTCRVVCNGASTCDGDTINCGTSACQLRCIGKNACKNSTFEADNAASLCVFCNGDPACGASCSPPMTCVRQFTGGAGNDVGGCVMCPTGTCN